jgi:hypothetical protein
MAATIATTACLRCSSTRQGFVKDWRLSLAAFVLRFTHTRMPIFVLSMSVAEPPSASRAMHCCRITTRPIIGRHALTQSLEVGAFLFVEFFEHRHTLG